MAGLLAAALVLHVGASTTPSRAGLLLEERFDHPDGALVDVADGRWLTQSGTPGQVEVASGAVVLTQQESEDVRTTLPGGPFSAAGGAVFYLACTVRFTDLPSGAGSYFAHFKDGSTGFRGRLFASVQGAGPGTFRLGVAEASNTPTLLEEDLRLDTAYTVVCRYDAGTAATMLWVNPTTELDPGVAAADDGTAVTIHGLALRQSSSGGNGMGTVVVDDLRVATRFVELFGADDPRPSIEQQPQGQSVAAGQTVVFTVRATGGLPLTYQWLRDGLALLGAVEAELTLWGVTAADAGSYQVAVNNAAGSVTSDAATLTVREASGLEIGAIVCVADAQGGLTLRWPGRPGQRYVVLGASTPDGPWTELAADIETPEFAETMSAAPGARYYRILVPWQ